MQTGRIFKFGDDVDTDQIIASQYIILPSIEEMKGHAFESLDGEFAKKVQPGDVVLGGANFGCGSSREQAPAVLKALGVQAVVAKSYARIFYRNAINIGLPVIVCTEVYAAVQIGDEVTVDLAAGTIMAGGQSYACTRLPAHMQSILSAGGLIPSLNAEGAQIDEEVCAQDVSRPSIGLRMCSAREGEEYPVCKPEGSPLVKAAAAVPPPAAAASQPSLTRLGAVRDASGSPSQDEGSVHCALTMAEKIIASAAGVPFVRPGQIHTVQLDQMMTNDGTTHITIDMYEQKLKHPRLANPAKMVFVVDHNSPADSPKTAAAHRKMRDFARENSGIAYYEGKGVCHQLMVENHVRSGEFIIGADSHTCTYGALGAFGTGVGSTDFLYGMVTGTTWVMVPESLKFVLHGHLPAGVTPRDLMLTIIGDIGADGATYKVMEFTGDGLGAMEVNERLALSNLAVEAGAKTALMAADDKVLSYLKAHGRSPKAVFESDEGATYAAEYHYDLSKITPVVARPHHIDDVVPAEKAAGVKIDEAFLGSCNNGRIEELRIAAGLLKGHTVHPMVRFIVSPASNAVYTQALSEGLLQTLSAAGAMVVNPNCSVCWGSCQGVIGPGEVLISTGTRNFRGRAGHPDSEVYLASAATVTASAIKGEITTADRL